MSSNGCGFSLVFLCFFLDGPIQYIFGERGLIKDIFLYSHFVLGCKLILFMKYVSNTYIKNKNKIVCLIFFYAVVG